MNSVNIIGNIGHDLELRQTNSGKSVMNFNIAVSNRDETGWFRIVVWGKVAENVNKYCGKGSKVAVSGRLQTNSYTDNDGNKRSNVEIVAFGVEFLDSKNDKPTNKQSNNKQDNKYSDFDEDQFKDNDDSIQINNDDLPF